MGEAVWHLVRARHHSAFAEAVHRDLSEFADWSAVGLAYSALHYVHALLDGEPDLPKDERHPRKHTAPRRAAVGGRGVNQLVRDLYPSLRGPYMSLFEAGRRTRYDLDQLDDAYTRLRAQLSQVERFALDRLGERGVERVDE